MMKKGRSPPRPRGAAREPGYEGDEKFQDVAPEVEEQGDEGAEVERHVEGEPRRGPVQEARDEDQVSRAADGKDLGESLYDAENGCVQ